MAGLQFLELGGSFGACGEGFGRAVVRVALFEFVDFPASPPSPASADELGLFLIVLGA